MKTLDIKTAASHIKQARDESRQSKHRSPFFFLVGAGISHPPIPLASEIESDCKAIAAKYKRLDEPSGTRAIDKYSHWFGTAFPQPIQRQAYLRRLIEHKPISHANLRLAHLLLGQTITNLVVTTNFDDLLSRALTLFGRPHVICDHPNTVERIDPELEDLQLVHVHGTYWFYDCCNLQGELQTRAKPSAHTTLTMASLLDNILSHRSPIVIGYSGWEGDVFMGALQRRLQTRLPFNLYWFCHRSTAPDFLPNWLKLHEDVYLVLPASKEAIPEGVAEIRAKEQQSGEQLDLNTGVRSKLLPEKEREEPTLSAQQALDELIQSFGLPAPELTTHPLSFFAKQLRSSLPHGSTGKPEGDFYFIDSVIMRIERATQRENESVQIIESQLEDVRDALRRSQYGEGITKALRIQVEDLSEAQLNELMGAMRAATLGLADDSPEQLNGHQLGTTLAEHLLRLRPEDMTLEMGLADSLVRKGVTLMNQERHPDSIAAYDEVIKRYGERPESALRRWVITALALKAQVLRVLDRDEDALATYNQIVRRFGEQSETYFRERVAEAFLEKGNIENERGQKDDAISSYDEILKRFGNWKEGRLPKIVARTLIRKGIALDSLDRTEEALKTYDEVEGRFGDGADPTLNPQRREALRRKGQRLLLLNQADDALKTYQHVLRIEPKDLGGIAGVGNSLRTMGQYESAIAMYQSLLVLDPKYAFGYVLIAEAQFDLGMYDEVISSLNQSILNRPQYAQAYFELAELYRELGEFEKAREACQSAEEADKTTSVGLYQLALVENAATNNPEALRLIEQALKMPDANFSWLYKIQGDIYVDLGQYEKATSSYEKALEQGSKTAYNGKGHLQLLLGQLGEAEGSFIQATKFLPANPRPRLNLAILYGITGRQDLANTLFSEVISVFPSTQRPSRVLTRIKAMVGLRSFEEALRTLSDLRSKVPNLSRRANDFWHDLELMSRIPTIQVGAKKFSQDARRILGTDRIE